MKKYNSYIIASAGLWNEQLFKKNSFPKNFHFVSNISELNTKLKKIKPKYIFLFIGILLFVKVFTQNLSVFDFI